MKFTAAQFTPTQWDTAAQKAKFCNHFVRFIEKDCPETLFYDWFYRRLSNCFYHIAEFNRFGFYSVWFAPGKARFLQHCIKHECYGDPAYTYSDAEKLLVAWIQEKYPHLTYQQLTF